MRNYSILILFSLFILCCVAPKGRAIGASIDSISVNNYIEKKVRENIIDQNKLFENTLSVHDKTISTQSTIIEWSGWVLTLAGIIVTIFAAVVSSWIAKKYKEIEVVEKEINSRFVEINNIKSDYTAMKENINNELDIVNRTSEKISTLLEYIEPFKQEEFNFYFSIYCPTEAQKKLVDKACDGIYILLKFNSSITDKQNFVLGLHCYYNKKYDETVEYIDAMNVADFNGLFIKGLSYFNSEDFSKAKDCFETVIGMKKEFFAAYYYLKKIDEYFILPQREIDSIILAIIEKEEKAGKILTSMNSSITTQDDDENNSRLEHEQEQEELSHEFMKVIGEIKNDVGSNSVYLGFHQNIYQTQFKKNIQELLKTSEGEIIYG